MENEISKEIERLQIQIGCIIRLGRLKKGLSQLDLALKFGSNSTLIGRIERGETISGWDKIYILIKALEIKINDLFILKSKDELLNIVADSKKLEQKLTKEKAKYYLSLQESIKELFE